MLQISSATSLKVCRSSQGSRVWFAFVEKVIDKFGNYYLKIPNLTENIWSLNAISILI